MSPSLEPQQGCQLLLMPGKLPSEQKCLIRRLELKEASLRCHLTQGTLNAVPSVSDPVENPTPVPSPCLFPVFVAVSQLAELGTGKGASDSL